LAGHGSVLGQQYLNITPSSRFSFSLSLFTSLQAVKESESEALKNQTVISTQLAKDIIHGVNLMPSPFALTTLSSLKKY